MLLPHFFPPPESHDTTHRGSLPHITCQSRSFFWSYTHCLFSPGATAPEVTDLVQSIKADVSWMLDFLLMLSSLGSTTFHLIYTNVRRRRRTSSRRRHCFTLYTHTTHYCLTMSGVVSRLYHHAVPVGRLSCRAAALRTPVSCITHRVSMTTPSTRNAVLATTRYSREFHSTPAAQTVDTVKRSPKALLPEFSLKDKVIIVSGGAQGLGLVQTEALLEAGAKGKGTFSPPRVLACLQSLKIPP